MRIIGIASLAMLMLGLSVAVPLACSCELKSPLEQLDASDVVVVALVVSTQELTGADGMPVSRSLVILESVWKGEPGPSFHVESTMLASCEFSLRQGTKYLIYANSGLDDDMFTTHMCMRTRPVDDAVDDFAELGPPESGSTPIETLTWGHVKARYK